MQAHQRVMSQSNKRPAEIIGYVHNLSPVKKNRGATMTYASFTLQTKDETREALIYSTQKRHLFQQSQTMRRPIKIEDYMFTEDKDKLVVNDKSQVTAPQQCEYDFQYREITTPQSPRVSIFDVLNQQKERATVTVIAKVIKKSETKTVGKNNLKLCEVVVADESAFMPLDVWEDHISTVEQEKLYTLQSVQLRIWAGKKKLATTQRTTITE